MNDAMNAMAPQAQEGAAEQTPTTVLGGASPQTPQQPAGADSQPPTPQQEAAQYEQFNVPEGFEYNDGQVNEFAAIARELNLTQQQAQKMIDMHTRAWMGHKEQLERTQEEWANKTRNHPEFGGQKFESSLADALKFVDAFGGDELKAILNETGVGNHPVLFAAFARAGRMLGEDRLVSGTTRAPSGSGTFADLANTMYPEMGKGGNR